MEIPKDGVVYFRHRKTGVLYESLGVAMNTETNKPTMVYRNKSGFTFVLDVEIFDKKFIRV